MDQLDPEQQPREVDQAIRQEPSAMGAEAASARFLHPLRAFGHRNYSLFFSGQIISLTGTWLQSVALGWLVYDLTNSKRLLGIVSAIGSVPVLVLTLFAGVVADRICKRNVLVATQTCLALLALTLAILVKTGAVTVYYIVALGFLLGAVQAFDVPTRQSFIVEMVGKDDLPNAIALNSVTFNSARILGPAVAGIVIAQMGMAGAFFVNSASYVPVIIALMFMTVKPMARIEHAAMALQLKEGFRFIRGHRMVTGLLILAGAVSIFSMPYAVLMPVFARDILKAGPKGMGYLVSSIGAGALIGAMLLSFLGDVKWKGKLLLAGNITACTMLVLFSFSRALPLSMALLVGVGWGMMTNMALTNTLIQTCVPDELRGRVVSVYVLMFMGMAPLGSFQAGMIAEWLGAPWAVRIGAFVCASAAIILSPRFIKTKQ